MGANHPYPNAPKAAGEAMAKELGFDAVTMGYVFSAFAWSYVLAQLPGGWLLDRYGVKWVYAAAIFLHRHSYDSYGASKATSGCVSLAHADLVSVLRRLRPGVLFAIGTSSWLLDPTHLVVGNPVD